MQPFTAEADTVGRMPSRRDEPDAAWLDALDAALRRRQVNVNVQQVVKSLIDAFDLGAADRSLTDDERRFMTAAGGPTDVRVDRNRAADGIWRAASAIWAAHRQASWATPDEAAALLGIDLSDLRIPQATGDIHFTRRFDGTLALPSWQYTADGRITPHVTDVVGTFPADFPAVDIETVMTTPVEELKDQSPAEWLQAGLPLEDVLMFIDELSWL